jgi:hypothetical protein
VGEEMLEVESLRGAGTKGDNSKMLIFIVKKCLSEVQCAII